MQEELIKFGLSENEANVFLALLDMGESTVGPLISQLNIHRQSVYNALLDLEKKNLICKTIKNRIQRFQVANPDYLIESVKKQELIANRLSKLIKERIKQNPVTNIIRVYDEKEKIRNFYLQKLKKISAGSCYDMLSIVGGKFEEIVGRDYLVNKYDKIRKKREIRSRALAAEKVRQEMGKFDFLDADLRETKYLPFGSINPIGIIIWDKSVSYQFFFGPKPFILDIENMELRNSLLDHFNELWKIAKY